MMDVVKAYVFFTWLLFAAIFLTPYFSLAGIDTSASYNAFSLLCHQYPGRSYGAFPSGISACGVEGGVVLTVYDQFLGKPYNGTFSYNREDIGVNRAQVCVVGKEVGFKFPVCARDLGFYFGLAFASLLYFSRRKELPLKLFVLLVLPFAIDGTGQFVGLWESTNTIRLSTGFLAGVAASLLIGRSLDE